MPPPVASVLACGYRDIHIAKSGLKFPAWLVQVDAFTGDEQSGEEKASQRIFLLWRSKRDFWRLARQTAGIPFPKAAWSKLARESPWKRPDLDSFLSNSHGERDGYDQRELGRLDHSQQNNWERHMTKSLKQIDQYLQNVATHCVTDNNPQIVQSWREFLQGPGLCDPTTDQEEGGDEKTKQGVAASTDTNSGAILPCPAVGNALGQYFCHPLNAQQLVTEALNRLRRICKYANPGQHVGNNDTSFDSPILFVEPSCGYGQIVQSLLETLQNTTTIATKEGEGVPLENYQILGVDLDETAISRCQQSFDGMGNVHFCRANFLETFPPRNGMKNPSSSPGTTTNAQQVIKVVVGGPPYTAGAGRGGVFDDKKAQQLLLGRDLPLQFVQHAIQAYAAMVICLLLPARCQKIDYTRDGWIPADYAYETIPLQAPSVFYFQGGSEPVTQPSVIQCFWKTTKGEHTMNSP